MPPKAEALLSPGIDSSSGSPSFCRFTDEDILVEKAAYELESIRGGADQLHPFPPNCYNLLKSLSGNHKCIDCGAFDPDWATISYGALICMRCCGRHRGMGVKVSDPASEFYPNLLLYCESKVAKLFCLPIAFQSPFANDGSLVARTDSENAGGGQRTVGALF